MLVLPPLAVQPEGSAFYDAETKLDSAGEHTVSYSQASLPAPVLEQLKDQSLKLWDGLGCRGIARIDFIVTENQTFALEVNTIPGLSRESNFVMAASRAGLSHGDIVLALLHEALHRSWDNVPLPVGDLSPGQPLGA